MGIREIFLGSLMLTPIIHFSAWIAKLKAHQRGMEFFTDRIPWYILSPMIFVGLFIALSVHTRINPPSPPEMSERTQYVLERIDRLRDNPSSTLILEVMLDWLVIDQAQHDAMLYDLEFVSMVRAVPPEFWAEAHVGELMDKFNLFARTFAITPEP
ncbi:MAG: hypothetical protein FWG87_00080 [Defluviitaleaceae bacterium]|nr:hypothetical protein [Defluviitaleaceae bacterium]